MSRLRRRLARGRLTRSRLARVRWRVVALALLVACAVNPVTGEREILIMSPAEEAAAGKQGAEQVAREMGLVDDPELRQYVAEIGARLAKHSPRQEVTYHFDVVDMPEANAFALPGGYVYVSRGLLALVNTEAELANVIGHEIGHVAARHHAQRQTRAAGVGIASALGSIAAGVLGGSSAASAAAQLGQVAGAGLIASYSRDQEHQSDEVGQAMAAQAGWSAEGMTQFLSSLDAETRLQLGGTRGASFLDSHPSTPARVEATAARARALPQGATWVLARDRASFLARLDGLLVGDDPAQGIFRDSLFVHPVLDFQIQYPNSWATRNAATAVGAVSPDQQAIVKLVARGPGSDPRAVAERDAAEGKLQLQDAGPRRIGGLSAWHARTRIAAQGGVTLRIELTWIAHRGFVYRIDGMVNEDKLEQHGAALTRTAQSFRPLSAAERAGIAARRLRVARARQGETLAALSRRTGNVWDVPRTSVMNAISETERLRAGDPIKIARDEALR
jgi:predicted Zn-dependent protease